MEPVREHDLVKTIVWELDRSPSEATKYLQAFIESAQDMLLEQQDVEIPGFGKLHFADEALCFQRHLDAPNTEPED